MTGEGRRDAAMAELELADEELRAAETSGCAPERTRPPARRSVASCQGPPLSSSGSGHSASGGITR